MCSEAEYINVNYFRSYVRLYVRVQDCKAFRSVLSYCAEESWQLAAKYGNLPFMCQAVWRLRRRCAGFVWLDFSACFLSCRVFFTHAHLLLKREGTYGQRRTCFCDFVSWWMMNEWMNDVYYMHRDMYVFILLAVVSLSSNIRGSPCLDISFTS